MTRSEFQPTSQPTTGKQRSSWTEKTEGVLWNRGTFKKSTDVVVTSFNSRVSLNSHR